MTYVFGRLKPDVLSWHLQGAWMWGGGRILQVQFGRGRWGISDPGYGCEIGSS